MEIKRDSFFKEVGVGRDLEAGERAPGKMKEGCLGRPQEKKKKTVKAGRGERVHRRQINETNEKRSESFLMQR